MNPSYVSKTNIVISCWNAIEHTKITIESLFNTIHHPFLLTIIDNGSRDGTDAYLRNLILPRFCEKLTIISNQENKGAGEAINQGQEISKSYSIEYTCLCNNDLLFSDNWLKSLEDVMDINTRLGILGTLRPAVDTSHHIRAESAKFVVDNTPKGYSIQQELKHFQGEYSFEETSRMLVHKNGGGIQILRCPPNAVVTCCALVRNSVSEKIGPFSDPQFKIYGSDDIDLSWRLEKAGFVCAVLKDVYVHHFRHRSITDSNLDREKFLLENNIIFFNKWRKEIFSFLDNEQKKGVDIFANMNTEENSEYFFLRKIGEKVNLMSKYIQYHNEHNKLNHPRGINP